jgi:hypothetical protein
MTTRRSFLQLSASSGLALACEASRPQTPVPMLNEADKQAQALGYVAEAARVNKAMFPKYVEGQRCAACQLYQGQPTADVAPCSLFGGRRVPGPGWCSAFVARPA